jgi:general secretion pathway protein G
VKPATIRQESPTMMLSAPRTAATRRSAFTLLEVLVVVAILVILAGVGVVATTRYLEDARKSKAQLQCRTIATAMEAFHTNPSSNGQYPTDMNMLISPPWGGSSYLRDPQSDTTDPWGRQGAFNITMTSTDGTTEVPMVTVQAPDGVHISNFGIGDTARW